MPRNMSFALTTEQIKDHSKTVTRRSGWEFLQPGTVLNACVKCMGRKPGEKLEKLGQIRVTSVRRERLDAVTDDDVRREGFPEMDAQQFIHFFLSHMGGQRAQMVTRIEFEHL